ncbi:MAG: hypothetical protein WEB60_00150 [Terrimicrobiaceae bacterium]
MSRCVGVLNGPGLRGTASLPLLVFLILLGFSHPSEAYRQLSGLRFAPGSGIDIKITNFYDDLPPLGFLPLRVDVQNDSAGAREWTLQSLHMLGESRSALSTTKIAVPARERRTFDLLVPLAPPLSNTSRYSNLTIGVSGFGVTSGAASEYSSGGGRTPTPYLGMGKALSVKHWAALRELYDTSRSESLEGTPLDMAYMPADWRALAGFDRIILDAGEWRSLEPAPRAALKDWIAQGGSLTLIHEGSEVPPDLPQAGPLGAGSLEIATRQENFPEQARDLLQSSGTLVGLMNSYSWDWTLASQIGRPSPPHALIIAFVLAFAVIIGPVNFLVFAPAGRRHRLFWTTPLISLLASVLMGAAIVLSEGFGGTGGRFDVTLIRPEDKKMVRWQEQVSRTGVLISDAFPNAQPTLLAPIDLRKPGTTLARGARGSSFSLNGNTWSGDWFRSRATQAQALTAISESRERLKVTTDAGGTLIAESSFASPLENLWVTDEAGAFWKTARLETGEKKPLTAATKEDFQTWFTQQLESAGPLIKARAEALGKTPQQGQFFASWNRPAMTTLSSIRWSTTPGVLIGSTQP